MSKKGDSHGRLTRATGRQTGEQDRPVQPEQDDYPPISRECCCGRPGCDGRGPWPGETT